ncbi:MAG TPA: ABC transporter permease [Candidatus Bathyarchaeia archaeon]|nr:ABC transporter permease [Candidatus Bathyarchaeia archaeon]
MAKPWTNTLVKAFYIALKDAKVYYFKAPNFTFGLLIPVSLFLAFSMAGKITPVLIVAGLSSLATLFGTTSIEAVAVVLEKQTGTLDRLLVAPLSLFTIILGKTMAGFFFGLILAAVTIFPLAIFSGVTVMNPLLAIVAIAFASMAFSALGIVTSAYANWVPDAQMYANFLRFPMTFLSGTFAALETYPVQLQVVSRFLPLTYSVEALRNSITHSAVTDIYLIDIAVLFVFTVMFLSIATAVLKKRLA